MDHIFIDEQEVLRYLGHKGQPVDERTVALVRTSVDVCKKIVRPKRIHRAFSLERALPPNQPKLGLAGTQTVLPGADIARHLADCFHCVWMAVTLGVEVENHIRMLQNTQLTGALVFDAVASACVEAVCDAFESELRAGFSAEGKQLTTRFSPGYGDFPLSLQPEVLRLLDAGRKIGLYCQNSYILMPRKSVTAVLGVRESACSDGREAVRDTSKCASCAQNGTCPYAKNNE